MPREVVFRGVFIEAIELLLLLVTERGVVTVVVVVVGTVFLPLLVDLVDDVLVDVEDADLLVTMG